MQYALSQLVLDVVGDLMSKVEELDCMQTPY